MADERNVSQIIRKDARNCFVESLSDSFANGRAHFAFATYDLSKPTGQRQTNSIHIYISIPELRELCRKLSSGELRYIMQQMKQNGDNKSIQEWLGGTSAEKLRQYGKARQDGKSLSRVCKLLAGQKTDFLLIADSGPGDKDAKGLIVPRFGNKPENHVAVSMTFESLSELLLMTKTHYEAWLTAWYLSQRQSTHQQNLMPANWHAAAQLHSRQEYLNTPARKCFNKKWAVFKRLPIKLGFRPILARKDSENGVV